MAAELVDGDGERVGQLVVVGLAVVDRAERARRGDGLAVEAAHRAGRPVLAPQLVQHGAVDARPQELLERRALVGS